MYCKYHYDAWSKRCRECKYPCNSEIHKRVDDRVYEETQAAREYRAYCDKMDENWK